MAGEFKSSDVCEPGCFPDDAQLKALVRKFFQRLPMVRAFQDDYEVGVGLLRAVFDAGRSRGAVEAEGGSR